jgi:hypothetical protein
MIGDRQDLHARAEDFSRRAAAAANEMDRVQLQTLAQAYSELAEKAATRPPTGELRWIKLD